MLIEGRRPVGRLPSQWWMRSSCRRNAPGPNDWMFASPTQIGRLPWSYDRVCEYKKAGAKAGIGGPGMHSLRYT